MHCGVWAERESEASRRSINAQWDYLTVSVATLLTELLALFSNFLFNDIMYSPENTMPGGFNTPAQGKKACEVFSTAISRSKSPIHFCPVWNKYDRT